MEELITRLRACGDPVKKTWWEKYLKSVIEFYGVPMAQIRSAVHAWAEERAMAPEELRSAAFDLMRRPIAEEKLAGILVMQELLLPIEELSAGRDLPVIASIFDAGQIWEWNTTDWLCVRVLGPMIEQQGRPTAERIATWAGAPGLWRRRAAAVAFVPAVRAVTACSLVWSIWYSASAPRTCAMRSGSRRPAWAGCCGI